MGVCRHLPVAVVEVDRALLLVHAALAHHALVPLAVVESHQRLAVGETVILLHPPLPSVGISIETMRECQQIDSLADGYQRPRPDRPALRRLRCEDDDGYKMAFVG